MAAEFGRAGPTAEAALAARLRPAPASTRPEDDDDALWALGPGQAAAIIALVLAAGRLLAYFT